MKDPMCQRCKDKYSYEAYFLASCYSAQLCKSCLRDWQNHCAGLENFRKLIMNEAKIQRAQHIKSYALDLEGLIYDQFKLKNEFTLQIIEWLNSKPED